MEQAVKAESHQCKQVGESYYEARILQLETPADEFASLLNRISTAAIPTKLTTTPAA